MTLKEVAAELVAGCRENRARDNLAVLYADDAVSVEAADMGGGTTVQGIAAIQAKHDWWEANHTINSATVEGPFPHGDDRFAVIFESDVTVKETRAQWKMREVAVYYVTGGKISREEFFYET